MYQGHANETTPMVYADYTGHVIMQQKHTMTSKYQLAQSYMLKHLVMETNIPTNVQANIEQVRPVPDK